MVIFFWLKFKQYPFRGANMTFRNKIPTVN